MKVIKFKSGISNIYFIKSAVGWLIVDGGIPGKKRKLHNFMEKNKIKPCDVKLIVVTHVHYDHAGMLDYLKFLTSAKIIVHESEKDILENGITIIPPARTLITRIFNPLLVKLFKNIITFRKVKADETFRKELDLRFWGFNADIIHTPGHTKGSVSIIFESGESFVGDTCYNVMRRFVIPPFYDDKSQLIESMEKINEKGAKTIYPGHGSHFNINKLHKTIAESKK